ncbi:NADH-quinone oxidoreductase subunit K [Ectothiorhodospiraceae bacterium 2226]|nr:NADH-quinone oxidoreductase subunit K [Ectothiorhodospiraceae bacterium 2226]
MVVIYAFLAAALFGLGLHGLVANRHLLRKILALNVMTSAVFLMLVVVAHAAPVVDPVPHAMVLTGIVVTVSTTAAALALLVRLHSGHRGAAE